MRRIYTLALILLASIRALAQDQSEDVLMKAMQDELERSMTELKAPNLDKPFFIMLGLTDQRLHVVSASMGALSYSETIPQRFKTNSRVLVGDYAFNDESLEDNLYSSPTALDLELPIDNDYWGVRRAFWSTTDNVYRDATRHFEKHKETLLESKKELKDIPHRWFGQTPPVVLNQPLQVRTFDKKKWEHVARELSAIYGNEPSVVTSSVEIRQVEGYRYIVSSEGTRIKVPFSFASFISYAQHRNSDGHVSASSVIHIAYEAGNLPAVDKLRMEIQQSLAEAGVVVKLPKLEEEYAGPVLFMGAAVGDYLSDAFFRGREQLTASHAIPNNSGYQYEAGSLNSKIGKSICGEQVTVNVKSKMKQCQGIDLVGSFEVDHEGVVPADNLMLVENGMLKNLLNSRTLSHELHTANGHSSGPGVVEILIAKKFTESELKEKLLRQAKEEGLAFALIVREDPHIRSVPLTAYKVWVADGREERVQSVLIEPATLRATRKIVGASNGMQVQHIGGLENGAVTSLIVPQALLIEELVVQPMQAPVMKEEEFVSSPLKKVK